MSSFEIRGGGEPMTLRSTGGRVSVTWGPASAPDLLLTGPGGAIVGLFARRIDLDEAITRGLAITGNPRLLRKLRPAARATVPR